MSQAGDAGEEKDGRRVGRPLRGSEVGIGTGCERDRASPWRCS